MKQSLDLLGGKGWLGFYLHIFLSAWTLAIVACRALTDDVDSKFTQNLQASTHGRLSVRQSSIENS